MKLRNRKTGEILEIKLIQTNCECLTEHEIDTYYGKPITLELLNCMCEDYVPLIKDKKIRKAIRAWADANGIEEDVGVVMHREITTICDDHSDITFYGNLAGLIDGAKYTIAELCGDEA